MGVSDPLAAGMCQPGNSGEAPILLGGTEQINGTGGFRMELQEGFGQESQDLGVKAEMEQP